MPQPVTLKKLKLNGFTKTYKTIPMEKNCKKAKWLSGEALQIAVKRREVKSKKNRKDISI